GDGEDGGAAGGDRADRARGDADEDRVRVGEDGHVGGEGGGAEGGADVDRAAGGDAGDLEGGRRHAHRDRDGQGRGHRRQIGGGDVDRRVGGRGAIDGDGE